MSQPPNYVVRQDTGGELKLLLVRDPRATEAASKHSPVKKQPAVSLLAVSQLTSSSSHVMMNTTTEKNQTTSPSSKPQSVVPSSPSQPSSSSSTVHISPTKSTPKSSKTISPSSTTNISGGAGKSVIVVSRGSGGGGGKGGRVKGGKIVKPHSKPSLQKSPTSSTFSAKTSSNSSSSSPQSSSRSSDHGGGGGEGGGGGGRSRSQPPTLLPVSRVRNIMRTDIHTSQMTNSLSQDSVAVVAKATELFISQLIRDAHKMGVATGERDVVYRHLSMAVRKDKKTEFLHDILPEKVVVRDYLASLGNQPDHTPSNTHSS